MQVNEFLEKSAISHPHKEALVSRSKKFTFQDINARANQLAHAFMACSLKKQDRVVIYLENSIESVLSVFAVLKAGGVFVIVNPQTKAQKLQYILNDCQAKVLVTDTRHLQPVSALLRTCPHLGTILLTDVKSEFSGKELFDHVQCLRFYDILESQSTQPPPQRCIDIDLASLIYTSGSTGTPKGVMLTHLNMVSAASSITEYLENTSDDVILDCLPLSFDYGLYQVLMAFKCAGKVILEPSFTYPYQVIDLLIKEKVTGFPIVPTILAIILQLKNVKNFDLSHLRYITNTAQALPVKYIFQLRELLPHVKIYSMYGLTECKRVSYLSPDELEKRPTSVGKAMPNVEVYIVDEAGNKVTTPGAIGELVVRGSNVMQGYWNLPEETQKRLKLGFYPNERILYTNDLFKMDEDGFLYFVARKDDIIKTAGEMVSPKEVENVLYELEDVVEAAVIGVADEILGNAIKAFVVLASGSKLTEKEILRFCQQRLEQFMVPKTIECRAELPKTTTGKIKKKELV